VSNFAQSAANAAMTTSTNYALGTANNVSNWVNSVSNFAQSAANAAMTTSTNYALGTANNVSNWVNSVSNFAQSAANAAMTTSTNYALGTANNVSNWVNAVSNRVDSADVALTNALKGKQTGDFVLSNLVGTVSGNATSILGGANITVTSNAGVYTIAGAAGTGGITSSNATQFLGVPLSIKNGAAVTNIDERATMTASNVYVHNSLQFSNSSGLHWEIVSGMDAHGQPSLIFSNQFLGTVAASLKDSDGSFYIETNFLCYGTAYFDKEVQIYANSYFDLVTANRVAIFDANYFLTNSVVTDTELGYLGGVTGSIVTNFDARAATIFVNAADVALTNNANSRQGGTKMLTNVGNVVVVALGVTGLTNLTGLDFSTANNFTYTLTNNIYFVAFTNGVPMQEIKFDLRQGGAGGFTVSFDTNYWKAPSGQYLTMATNVNARMAICGWVEQFGTNFFISQQPDYR
jgi:hypothetical protein